MALEGPKCCKYQHSWALDGTSSLASQFGFFALICFQHAEVEMSASLILAPVEVRDEAILWIRIKSELPALDSWGVRWTNGGMINLNQNSSHRCTNGVYPGLIG